MGGEVVDDDPVLSGAPLAVARRPIAHDSAEKQVTGTALYIDDLLEPAGTLHAVPGWCPSAVCGRLRGLDLDAVRRHDGVVAVLTAADIPGENDVSSSAHDEPLFSPDLIQFHGQLLFAVVATTREAARHAVLQARFEVEPIEPILDVRTASARGARLSPDYAYGRGDPKTVIAAARHRLTGEFPIGGQEHFYLEGQISLAIPGEDGEMFVHCSTQHPSEIQHTVAKVLGLANHAVTVEVRRMGGGFGGKETNGNTFAALAAVAARVTGRPVKVRLDRDDDMIMTGKRHDMLVDWSVGFDDDGVIEGAEIEFLANCGWSLDISTGVVDRAMFHADNAYFYPATAIRSQRLKLNKVSNTAFRGFGGPKGILAAERLIDAIALHLGEDALTIRKRNFYRDGRDRTPYGQLVEDNLLAEIVAKLEADADYWGRRRAVGAFNAQSRFLKKGLALTPLKFGISFTLMHLNQAGALVHVYSDGSIAINHGGTEMGQGLFLKVAQVVAEEFGVGMEAVRITATSTAKVPNTSPTAASSGSDLNGMAAQIACREIKSRMEAFLAAEYGAAADEIRFAGGHVTVGNISLPFPEVAKKCYIGRVGLSATGYYRTPDISWDRASASGRPFFYFAYGAALAEVIVDTLTGENKVLAVDILHDVGHSLNPAIDIGQIEGGFVQGMGWLTTEELVWDDKGRLRTHAPSTYKIPTAFDVPERFTTRLYVSRGPGVDTIFRSKAVGEPPLMLPACVFSAILDAVHASADEAHRHVVPPLVIPATPEAILAAIDAVRGG